MKNKNNIKWENPICNFCRKDKFEVLLKEVRYWEHDYSFKLVKCKSCDLIFITPRPEKTFISRFYKSDTYWGKDLRAKEIDKNWQQERDRSYRPIYQLIRKNRGAILDIGAGTGLFLSKFSKKKWITEGIEFSKEASIFAKMAYGLKIKVGDFLDFDFSENKFDYVIMNNVLEHLYKPKETLISVNKALKKNGALIVVVPNVDSLGFKIFNKNWYPLQPPIHLYQFSSKTIKMILESSGFNIKKISYSYFIHNFFSLFESFRSMFTKRNYSYNVKNNDIAFNNNPENEAKKAFKNFGIVFGKIFAFFFAYLGSLTKTGESIIIYAEKI